MSTYAVFLLFYMACLSSLPSYGQALRDNIDIRVSTGEADVIADKDLSAGMDRFSRWMTLKSMDRDISNAIEREANDRRSGRLKSADRELRTIHALRARRVIFESAPDE